MSPLARSFAACLGVALSCTPLDVHASEARIRGSFGPAYTHFHSDAVSSARGVELDLLVPMVGPLYWDFRTIFASSNVTYRPSTRPIHSFHVALAVGGAFRYERFRYVKPWLGTLAILQAFDTNPPQLFGSSWKPGSQYLFGAGPALGAGVDFSVRWLQVRASTLSTVLPDALSDRRLAGHSSVASLQLQF